MVQTPDGDADWDGIPTECDCDDNNGLDKDCDGFTAEFDCDDNDANTYPKAAYLESSTSCMRDQDGDGYGEHHKCYEYGICTRPNI